MFYIPKSLFVVPIVHNGAKKSAIISAQDLVVQLSIEQAMEESKEIFQTYYFSTREAARKRLFDEYCQSYAPALSA